MKKSDYELIQEYKDISTTNKPKIAPYHGDMFIDVEMEYLMRKELQSRIDKTIEFINSQSPDAGVSGKRIKEILKGEK